MGNAKFVTLVGFIGLSIYHPIDEGMTSTRANWFHVSLTIERRWSEKGGEHVGC